MSKVAFDPTADPVTVKQVWRIGSEREGLVHAHLEQPDPEMYRRLVELLTLAEKKGYSVRLSLITYEGEPSMVEQAEARKKRKGRTEDE